MDHQTDHIRHGTGILSGGEEGRGAEPQLTESTVLLTPLGIVVDTQEGTHSLSFGDDHRRRVETYLLVKKGVLDQAQTEFLQSRQLTTATTNSPEMASLLLRLTDLEDLETRTFPEEEVLDLLQRSSLTEESSPKRVLREAYLQLARFRVTRTMENWDTVLIQEVDALEECIDIINRVYERLQEWYGLHFPELTRQVKSPHLYATIVGLGRRESISREALTERGVDPHQAGRIVEAAEDSLGINLAEPEIELLREESEVFMSLEDLASSLESSVEETMFTMAPNIASVAGPVLAAKLISKAGGMRKLAKLPASTVQVLGAEKALFRALRKGAKPPKHGMIFEHPLINQAPRNLRGRLARLLASKITIASRVDAFGADDRSGELKEELDSRVAEIYDEEGREAP